MRAVSDYESIMYKMGTAGLVSDYDSKFDSSGKQFEYANYEYEMLAFSIVMSRLILSPRRQKRGKRGTFLFTMSDWMFTIFASV